METINRYLVIDNKIYDTYKDKLYSYNDITEAVTKAKLNLLEKDKPVNQLKDLKLMNKIKQSLIKSKG